MDRIGVNSKKIKSDSKKTYTRKCNTCPKEIVSKDKFKRFCDPCKRGERYVLGSYMESYNISE